MREVVSNMPQVVAGEDAGRVPLDCGLRMALQTVRALHSHFVTSCQVCVAYGIVLVGVDSDSAALPPHGVCVLVIVFEKSTEGQDLTYLQALVWNSIHTQA